MVYDCFLFYNELDVLEIRLNTLNSVVDRFVLAESTVTHTNKPKPLYYELNKKRFRKFKDKIVHVIIDDCPPVSNPWILERYQFTEIMRGLKNCRPEDTILHGPVDEIPNPSKISLWKNKPGKNKVFLMKLSYFYLNLMRANFQEWEGTRMFKYKDLKFFRDIYYTRYLKADVQIRNGGWHLSYIGDVKHIQKKMESMAHQEFNNSKYNSPERIKIAIAEGKDLFGMGLKFVPSPIEALPVYVGENKEKFKKLIVDNLESSKSYYQIRKLRFTISKFARNIPNILKVR